MTKASIDCLVLKMQEYINGDLDTTLFILYDKNNGDYLIRGKRNENIDKESPVPYSFYSNYVSDVVDFISFVICKKSKISYTLYNHDDLPNDSNDIDFDYLKDLDGDSGYELAGYDNQNYNKKDIMKYLRILKNVFNYY